MGRAGQIGAGFAGAGRACSCPVLCPSKAAVEQREGAMRRVVVTGLGIVSSIGNNAQDVTASLKAGKSGIVASEEMAEYGFRSRVAGTLKIDPAEHVDKRTLRFMGPG